MTETQDAVRPSLSPNPEVIPMTQPYPAAGAQPQRGPMPNSQPNPTNPHPHTRGPMTDPVTQTNHDPLQGAPMNATPVNATAPNTHAQPDDPDEPIPDTVPMLTTYDVARATLTGIACELGLDEVRVLVSIGERLKAGRQTYGRLHLATDLRTFRGVEARQELEDALVYFACAWLQTLTHDEVTR
jgi:hypothetical protein